MASSHVLGLHKLREVNVSRHDNSGVLSSLCANVYSDDALVVVKGNSCTCMKTLRCLPVICCLQLHRKAVLAIARRPYKVGSEAAAA